MANLARLAVRLQKIEHRVLEPLPDAFTHLLQAALQRASARQRLGLPTPEPPIVDRVDDPIGARLRWVWERQRRRP